MSLWAAHQRRLESIAIGAVHGAAEVDDPALRRRTRPSSRRGPARPAPVRAAPPRCAPVGAPPAHSRRAPADGPRPERLVERRGREVQLGELRTPAAAARGCGRARSAARRACARARARKLGARGDAEQLGLVDRRRRTSARSTRALASRPRERPSSDRLISVLGGSTSGVVAHERAAAAGLHEAVRGRAPRSRGARSRGSPPARRRASARTAAGRPAGAIPLSISLAISW